MSAVKELHYFDSDTADKSERLAQRCETQARTLMADGDSADWQQARAQDLQALAEMLRSPRDDHAAYLAYLNRGTTAQTKMIGDVTPAYAIQSEKGLREMAGLAPVVRFVYVMRDPIDRLWSHVRMMAARSLPDGVQMNLHANQMMEDALGDANSEPMLRSDYRGTLERLERATTPEQRHVMLFERMFQEHSIKKLCRFLGLSIQPAQTGRKVHAGRPVSLRDDLRAAAREALQEQYTAVQERFETLPARWQRHMAKVSG